MTTIKITDNRAILVKDNTVALAKWTKTNVRVKDAYGNFSHTRVREAWDEYRWPSNLEKAVDTLALEFMSDMELTLTMKEFKLYYQGAVDQIKAKING